MAYNGGTFNEWKLREEMCEIGRRVYNKGFAAANDGNISFRLDENRVLCTPTRVSKGFMKPDDLCIVDLDGKQVSGKKKRSSEILLHLTIMKTRPDVRSVVHCHPPHATAFAVAHEPIPKCTMPEFEVFLGEVAIAPYETPGTQTFADTIIPYIKDTDTVLLANHGTVTAGSDLMDAYFKTEIIDAYCRILILTKQLGRVEYYSDAKAAELIKIKPALGIRDVRLEKGLENCDLCANSLFQKGYSDFSPEPHAFHHPRQISEQSGPATEALVDAVVKSITGGGQPVNSAPAGNSSGLSADQFNALVSAVTDQVMAALGGSR
ncbi:MAG: class II aldolase/adducin family protein [bacterium]